MRISILAGTTEYSSRLAEMIKSFAPEASITEWTDPETLMRSVGTAGSAESEVPAGIVTEYFADMLFVNAESEGAVSAAEYVSDTMPGTAIVFIARDRFYAMDALRIHAQGYILEPVSEASLRREYVYCLKKQAAMSGILRGDFNREISIDPAGISAIEPTDRTDLDDGNEEVVSSDTCRISFRMDGGFDCLMDGVPVQFSRSKTRDLMEYLAGKHGAMVSDNELLMTLWGKENASTKSALRSTKAEMVSLFRDAGCEDAIVKHRGRIGIMMDRIS